MLETIDRFEDCYQIKKRKKISKIISFSTILILIIIISFLYFLYYPFEEIKTYYGTIITEGGETYVLIKTSNLDELESYKIHYLKIDDKVVDYEIVDVLNNDDYKEIILKLQLKHEPGIIKLKFILNEKTLFEKMKEDLKYGKNFKQ